MRLIKLSFLAAVVFPLALNVGCSSSGSSGSAGGNGGDGGNRGPGGSAGNGGEGGGTPAPVPYASSICVGAKQAAAATFCESLFGAQADFLTDQDDGALMTARDAAVAALGDAWDAAETAAEDEGADCSNLALEASAAGSSLGAAIDGVVSAISSGLNLDNVDEAACGADLANAAGTACEDVLDAEGAHISDLFADTDGAILESARTDALDTFVAAWDDATSGTCPTDAMRDDVGDDIAAMTDELVQNTIVAPGVDDQAFIMLEPGETDYLGRTYTPQCMQGSQYRYFAKRGSVNKLVMYYQGGGACWDFLTCGGVPDLTGATCKTEATPGDNPTGFSAGFADLSNSDNPFRDWHIVYVTYCTCDVHFGDATQEYQDTLTVQHKGFHNSKVAERWAREHFQNPEDVFVTGSSAGSYGALFNAPLLHEVWPASQIHALGDAGNGVITTEFLNNEFSNWNFTTNLPPIPGVIESITEGNGMPGYLESVADFFPGTNWANYSTMYDGGGGGQTGFFNVMLNGVLNAGTWWNASCEFGDTALSQAEDTYDAVLPGTDNYRYYFGTGSRHTAWGNDKVYDDTTGNVPTVVDWVNGMLASGPDGRDAAWTNVLCEDCGLLLDDDPRPNPLAAPFEARGQDTVVVCPPQ